MDRENAAIFLMGLQAALTAYIVYLMLIAQ